jgi:predicted transcriptional regulator
MGTTTIRVSTRARERAARLAARAGRPISAVVEEAIDAYQADLFWRQAERALDALAADPGARAEMMEEREAWEATLTDGLDRYEQE